MLSTVLIWEIQLIFIFVKPLLSVTSASDVKSFWILNRPQQEVNPISSLINQSINQSTNQSVSQSVCQLINQSINQTTFVLNKPVAQNPTIHMCTFLLQSVASALWDIAPMHYGICEMDLLNISKWFVDWRKFSGPTSSSFPAWLMRSTF